MKNNKPNNTFVFFTDVDVSTPYQDKINLTRAVNKAHVGDTPVNIYDEESGKYIANPDVAITEQHKEATWHVNAEHRVKLKITVDCLTGYFTYEIA